MGCASCSSNKEGGLPGGCNNNGWCSSGGCGNILDVYDWLSNIYYVDEAVKQDFVEVRFKGTHKGFFRNVNNLRLEMGQMVVVEANMGGFDVGHVSLVGPLVKVQMKKYRVKEESRDIRKVYRIATERDIEKWEESKKREYTTMMKARVHSRELGLEMKISDVEFQGDNTKATFYYTADGRVDFRELIKVFARNFKIKVEMRQIGLRQEAGRLGGIGSCGRELCCSTWLTDFSSVPTTAARYQNLFLNPLKLSGQCGRLKCCLNYELDTYLEALEDFPSDDTRIKTSKGLARVVKTDILRKVMYFVYQEDPTNKFHAIEVDDVKEILRLNEQGETLESFDEYVVEEEPETTEADFGGGEAVEGSLDRFDRKNKRKKRRPKGGQQNRQGNRNNKGPKNTGDKQGQKNQDSRPKRKPNPRNNKGKADKPTENAARPANDKANPTQKPRPEKSGTEAKRQGQSGNRRNNNRRRKPSDNRQNRGSGKDQNKPSGGGSSKPSE